MNGILGAGSDNSSLISKMSVRSKSGFPSVCFGFQIGLVRESVKINLDGNGELTLDNLKELACAFVDRKVIKYHQKEIG